MSKCRQFWCNKCYYSIHISNYTKPSIAISGQLTTYHGDLIISIEDAIKAIRRNRNKITLKRLKRIAKLQEYRQKENN
jgi:hypothetical protein